MTPPIIPLIVIVVAGFIAFAAGAVIAHRKGFKRDGEVIARCRDGHLFTTIWVGEFSWHKLDLGWAKIQRCPVDGRLTIVRAVEPGQLTTEEKKAAKQVVDPVGRPKRKVGP